MAVITGPALLARYNAATGDQDFLKRVQEAINNAAQAIASEATSTPNHANRVALSKAVTQPGATSAWALPFAQLICSQPNFDPADDVVVQNTVNACWNTPAGAL